MDYISLKLTANEIIAKSFQTICEMIKDRNTQPNYLGSISPDELIKIAENNNIFTITVNENTKIIYILDKMVTVEINNAIDPEKDMNIIFVHEKKWANNMSQKIFSKEDYRHIHWQKFDIRRLLINPYRHELVPPHIPITDKTEIAKLVKDYDLVSVAQFPHITSNDPIMQYLDIRPGTLVHIMRSSPTSGEIKTYRLCV